MTETLGAALIGELKRRGQHGMYFDYEGYRLLKEVRSTDARPTTCKRSWTSTDLSPYSRRMIPPSVPGNWRKPQYTMVCRRTNFGDRGGRL